MNRYAIIEAPSILGLKPTGVERLPSVLLQHGLADQLRARRAGRVVPAVAYNAERDPQTLMLNAPGIAAIVRSSSAACSRYDVAAVTGCCSSTGTRTSISPRR
jgi:hypothetical protein